MNLQPLGDRIIVKPLDAEDVTKGGIVLPDTAKEKPQEGEIVAIGKGKVTDDGKLQAMEVKKGDRVLYGKYSANEITTNKGEELLIMREDDVLAIDLHVLEGPSKQISATGLSASQVQSGEGALPDLYSEGHC